MGQLPEAKQRWSVYPLVSQTLWVEPVLPGNAYLHLPVPLKWTHAIRLV